MDSEPNNSVRLRVARVHNLKNVNVDIPRNALVVFIGISGSGKSSLAFGTLYAEAQRRYFESVSPYARRLMDQIAVPDVDSIEGLPPAVALQQQRGATSSRSSMGSITTLSNLLRMLYSGVGDYPRAQPTLYAEATKSLITRNMLRCCRLRGALSEFRTRGHCLSHLQPNNTFEDGLVARFRFAPSNSRPGAKSPAGIGTDKRGSGQNVPNQLNWGLHE